MARMPYRVFFWPSGSQPGHEKPGKIARATLHAAHTEAHSIAANGGTAHVHYVTPSGEQQLVTTYEPTGETPTRSSCPRTRFRARGPAIVATTLAVIAVIAAGRRVALTAARDTPPSAPLTLGRRRASIPRRRHGGRA